MSDVTRTHHAERLEQILTRAYRLEITEGPDRGRRLDTKARLIRIGSSPECELELSDDLASRLHARIEADVLGHRIIDLGSKNGTLVNGMRARDVYLPPGATIQVGASTIQYQPSDEQVAIELYRGDRFGRLIGNSKAMREIFAILERVSPSDMTVLVEGESGTGKELVADGIHKHSQRGGGPFVVFDCSAVAGNLIESELFGHVKGAFTGATSSRAGAFERASKGTLFLDEVGELPLELQPKLLRALEQREIRPVGGDRPIKVNPRIIAATNRSLLREVEAHSFREDLYYRLAVIRLVLPPLRRRTDDIPLLVRHFLEAANANTDQAVQVGYDTIIKLQRHRWPGNVRELRNFVERATMLASGNRLETRFLMPPSFGDTHTKGTTASNGEQLDAVGLAVADLDDDMPFKDAKARLIDAFERAYWSRLLERTGGNVSAAARVAGIHRKSAEYLLKKLNLRGTQGGGPDASGD